MAKYYESDITVLVRNLLEKQPAILEEQRKGRAMWWDKAPLTPDDQNRLSESLVKQQPYVYQTKG